MPQSRQSRVDRLVKEHVRLAERIAEARIRRLIGAGYLHDEIRSAALLGLTEAARQWDGRGQFAGWAQIRIRGAIKDALRRDDFLGRAGRKKWREAGTKGTPLERGDSFLAQLREEAGQEDHAERMLLRQRLTWEIQQLPQRLQIVLSLRYLEDLRLAEIGRVLGVTETRVHQLEREALDRLGMVMARGAAR